MSIPLSQFIRPPPPPPPRFPPLVSIRLFSTSVSLFLPCKQVHLYHFSRFHMYELIYDVCFSLSDLLHSVWQSLGPTTSLQMTQFCSFLWLSNIPLYIWNCIQYSREPDRRPIPTIHCVPHSSRIYVWGMEIMKPRSHLFSAKERGRLHMAVHTWVGFWRMNRSLPNGQRRQNVWYSNSIPSLLSTSAPFWGQCGPFCH